MSYILDALKRAESERSRGAVPNIHAQLAVPAVPEAARPTPLRIGLGVLALLIVLAAGWSVWWPGDVPPQPSGPITLAPAPVSLPMPAVTVVPAPVLQPVPAAAWAAPAVAPSRRPPVAVVAPAAVSPAVLPRARKAQAVASAVAALPASVPAAAPPAITSAATPATTDERVYALKELPDEVRSSLPALAVGGATYSENPASRMLIVNGRLFHEGDKLTNEVTLQQIKLRSAVLSYRGYRYSITY